MRQKKWAQKAPDVGVMETCAQNHKNLVKLKLKRNHSQTLLKGLLTRPSKMFTLSFSIKQVEFREGTVYI